MKRQGFPALQPYFESEIRIQAQPGCDYFSCISCTTAAPHGIKCCGELAQTPVAAPFASGITFLLALLITHYFSASKMHASGLTRNKRGRINGIEFKNSFGFQKNLCARTPKATGSLDMALFIWNAPASAGRKKSAPSGALFLQG
ncbi:hypothetical protein LFL96_15445 [Paraburkholderia sp. D15]|uniref:hypothetical protein n=1 Tax=Paraburkholderia sp. D15 TaxID=2880218 RepID=UPI00247A33A1|nr:hypothetical protein [Paraburkholderia sp. D15]WGS49146.1 hypothetical protein LFL96_15445 [Paraburkholderia sp. D15]